MAGTFAILELSPAAFEEICEKMAGAGYRHAFHLEGGRTVIDMGGVAVAREGGLHDIREVEGLGGPGGVWPVSEKVYTSGPVPALTEGHVKRCGVNPALATEKPDFEPPGQGRGREISDDEAALELGRVVTDLLRRVGPARGV